MSLRGLLLRLFVLRDEYKNCYKFYYFYKSLLSFAKLSLIKYLQDTD